MKGIKVTHRNLSTVFGYIKKILDKKGSLIEILEIENVTKYNQAQKALLNPADSYQIWNNIEFYYRSEKKERIDIGNQFASGNSRHVMIFPFCHPSEMLSSRGLSDTIYITSQGIFIKTWRGVYEKTMFYVIR